MLSRRYGFTMASAPKPHVARRRDGRRAEARGTAREKLLDSAAKVFAERGYRGTSVDLVAEDAGVTKGALYWHFKNKEELFFALIGERVDRRARELMQITETAPGEQETAPTISRGIADLVDSEPGLILLTHEYWSLAVREPKLLARYVERQRSLTGALARTLEARHETTGVRLTFPAAKLATAIIALANGLAMDRIADPEAIPAELLGETLALIYDGLVHRAEASDRPRNVSRRKGP
jgi:AcrR family transcriptional regulator